MGAVAKAVTGAVDTVVEAVGDAVESVGDAIKDVGKAIDQYVIQPIADDPLTAIATVAAAAYLGPAAASYFGTSAAVGTGIAAGAANAAAGLVQGESFDEAIKGGAMAGLTAGGMQAVFGAPAGEPSSGLDSVNGMDLASDQALANSTLPPVSDATPVPGGTNVEIGGPNPAQNGPIVEGTPPELSPTQTANAAQAPTPAAPTVQSPLQTLGQTTPTVEMPTYGVQNFTPDYSLGANLKPTEGFTFDKFTPADSFDMYGDANYSLTPNNVGGGPGIQPTAAPYQARFSGTGLTADVSGLPAYTENGLPTTFVGENGQVYGNATPDMTVSASGIRPTPDTIAYGNENMGTMSTWDKTMAGDFTGAAKDLGADAWAYAKENPWKTAGGVLLADMALNKPDIPTGGPPSGKGGTRDANFNKSLDLYAYLRDRNNYQGDMTKYGQKGQGGEQNFFQNTRFQPIPIQAKTGGLIHMKHFAQGGQMTQGGMLPGQPMVPQNAAGGRPVPPQGGRPPMMPPRGQQPQGGPQGGLQQGMPPQGQRPQMQNRNPKTSYYQYGNPPVQAKAMGGLSQVHSMKIGGGADGRSDDVNAVLSDGEYVMDAETVAMLGNGSSKAGAAKLDQMRSKLRQHKGQALAHGKISPDAKSPLAYLKGA